MDKRVLAHFDGDVSRANISPRKREKYLAKYARPGREAAPAHNHALDPVVEDIPTRCMAARCPGCGYTYEVEVGNELRGFRGRYRLDGHPATTGAAPTAASARRSTSCPSRGSRRDHEDQCRPRPVRRARDVRGMAHEYFELDDDDVMHVLDESPPESDRAKVHAAVQACPALALTLAG